MTIEIRTNNVEPLRQTYAHVARFQGADKPASRYLEGTIGLQMETNFHYRPIWAPEYEIFDKRRTAVTAEDWYRYKDPRQFYYGTYTITRSRQGETITRDFDFLEQQGLLANLDTDARQKALDFLIPLRHLEWGANMNCCTVLDYGWGAAVTQPFMFDSMDRLAMAQQLTRIAMLMVEDVEPLLDQVRTTWTDADHWQPLRQLVEETLVIEDWFELFIAQKVAIDSLVLPLAYQQLVPNIDASAGLPLAVNFMNDWLKEGQKWIDALVKFAVKENPQNSALIRDWSEQWVNRTTEALSPWVDAALGNCGADLLASQRQQLTARLKKSGVEL